MSENEIIKATEQIFECIMHIDEIVILFWYAR